MNSHRHIAQIVAACALAAMATACGSSGTGSSTTPAAPASSTSAATTPAATATSSSPSSTTGAAAKIKTNWETFFDASTPVAKRVSLLEDGSMFPTSALAATGLAAQAKAKVTAVTNVTASQATVKYDIYLGTTDALPHQTGTAVFQGGTWKVGVASFCGLLTLENGGKTTGLPAPCTSAG
jgi:hypothetical protein